MAKFRHRFAATLAVAALLTAMLGGGVAAAQTPGYPPTPTTTALCTHSTVDAGPVGVGQTITFTLCGPFTPGSTVAISVNGEEGGTKTANATGAIVVVIQITSTTAGLVNDPVAVGVNCGANQVAGTGPAALAAGNTTATGTFTLTCAAAAAAVASNSGLAFTGANVAKFLLAALLLIVIGAALVLMQRRRRTHAG